MLEKIKQFIQQLILSLCVGNNGYATNKIREVFANRSLLRRLAGGVWYKFYYKPRPNNICGPDIFWRHIYDTENAPWELYKDNYKLIAFDYWPNDMDWVHTETVALPGDLTDRIESMYFSNKQPTQQSNPQLIVQRIYIRCQ